MSRFFIKIFLLLLCSGSAYSQFAGAGTEASPYLLSTKADLETLADLLKNSSDDNYKKYGFYHYKIMADIKNITTPILTY